MDKVLLAVILAGFGTQLIKLIIYFFKNKSLKFKDIFVTGGMPSSHSAFVVSLATIIYLVEGASTAFAISLILAMIVLRDAYGVRRAVGEEGVIINKILKKVKMKTDTHFAMGHTPMQVIVGSLVGFAVSLLVFFLA